MSDNKFRIRDFSFLFPFKLNTFHFLLAWGRSIEPPFPGWMPARSPRLLLCWDRFMRVDFRLFLFAFWWRSASALQFHDIPSSPTGFDKKPNCIYCLLWWPKYFTVYYFLIYNFLIFICLFPNFPIFWLLLPLPYHKQGNIPNIRL